MPSPTETALSTLLPAVSFLPPDLVSLANSLLAQSRSKAASLKPEEEIGRIYAVTHIAAERLQKRLDLELDQPKPPCRPAVYKKLYTYLDGVLSMPGTTTPRREGESRRTRQQKSSPSTRKTLTNATKGTTAVVAESKPVEGIPDFIMPLVRAMCQATSTPKAGPHVVVGTGAVAREIASRTIKRGLDKEPGAKRRRRTPQGTKSQEVAVAGEDAGDAVAMDKWPALAIALHTLTVARMRGVETDTEEMVDVQDQARDAVEQHCIQNAATLPKELETVTAKSLKKSLDFYMLEAEDCGWLDMDWYRNVPENIEDGEDAAGHDEDEDDVDMEDEGPVTPRKRPSKTPLRRREKLGGKAALVAEGLFEDHLGAPGLLPGLGTMFQPAIDWLSDERRADYAKWKKSILKECAAIEAS